MKDNLLDFVKGRLEAGEGIAPEALARLRAVAREANPSAGRSFGCVPRFGAKRAVLLAATLALACCGWLVRARVSAHREADLTNVIALLQTADGAQVSESASLAESLLAWQDAPCVEFVAF